ncbi:cytochrome ubiquinol oxidase subunit I [Geobacter sp. DSM 9736]|uniref:cytochrome ubiquinol oxidase subunit I n=1 Tax=Geobacter sp. DSM 9736 TaxID=1277350 RepID=UPI000B50F68A|nr:cytochrome ubiquinol oxidase subunit I [Geobacter sp. DSM 9736]SNB46308.1 cytochrome bd-I ubiquinol oxidase subunit 1 apoprotein [Geobacter sp. DSM 9736]
MDNLLAARSLMGISLAFHIVYATIGIGLPLMLMIAEGLALRTGDETYHDMARSWVRPAGVLFAIGAVSGTILSFELGLLWPRFMEFSGPLIGLAFSMEGFAFFTEAIFLALYIYGERRLSRRALFFCTIPLTLAAAASAAFVISANGWMNTPSGFRLENGVPVDIRPYEALANPAWAHEAVHGTLAAYVATGFAMAGFYALRCLRGEGTGHNRRALSLSLAVAGVTLPLMLLSGDWAASFVARHQKPKLAAMEGHFRTMPGAPLVIGGWPDMEKREMRFALEIPKLLSVMVHRNPDAVVEGLDAFPAADSPDIRLVHPFFDLMVGSFFVMAAAAAGYWWLRWRRLDSPPGRKVLQLIVLASPFGMIALESGWMVTEFGRQPWVVQGIMRVEQGVTPHGGMFLLLGTFTTLYALLSVGLLWLLLIPRRNERNGGTEATRANS